MRQAGEHFADAVRDIGEGLTAPLHEAVSDHMTVTKVQDDAAAAGSTHYRVEVDAADVRAEVADELQDAADGLLAAWDELAQDAGDALPAEVPSAADVRKDVTSALDKGLSDSIEPVVVEVYLDKGSLSRVQVEDTTLTFAANPSLTEVTGAVSMDDDLVALLPLLASLGSLGEGADAGSLLPGLALTPDA
jgi:hypothetical protein